MPPKLNANRKPSSVTVDPPVGSVDPSARTVGSLLQVSGLDLHIGDQPILNRLGFSLERGRILGVVGESGSGKSLTALALMQLLPRGARLRGRIDFDGQDLCQLSEAALCRLRGQAIGMIFQEPMSALNPVHTIGQQVAESIRLHQRTGRRQALILAAEALERVGLPAERFPLSRYPHELSGGQRQRVVIAIAVALKPRLLIADEPTTALDVTTQAAILDLLRDLVRTDGMALMLISHDLAVVADMADQVLVMREGQIVEQGALDTVFSVRDHPYTRALFEASAHMPKRQPYQRDAAVLLEMEGVSCDYPIPRETFFDKPGTFRAVDDVSLCIRRGESVALVGESGCGKSTLTRALLGLSPIAAGTVSLQGVTMNAARGWSEREQRQLQVVFQDPYGSFNPRHKVARLVAEPLHVLSETLPEKTRRERVEEALASVGLPAGSAGRYIHEFSGGQRQRIAIARALILRPALIVLDEAVSALDVSVRAQVLDLLSDLRTRYGLAYLFISHDLSVVRTVSDRVLIMRHGKIVEAGETAAVFDDPTAPYTCELLAAAPKLPTYA